MGTLLGLEGLLMILSGLFAMYVIPLMLGYAPAWQLFVVGFLMALSYVGLYALTNLGGSKMPPTARTGIGILAYIATFYEPMLRLVGTLRQGELVVGVNLYFLVAPPLFGLLLAGLAALRHRTGERAAAALWALYAYAFPMLVVKYVLIRLVSGIEITEIIAIQGGALYFLVRGLIRIFLPTGPLIQRTIPDRVVGLLEGTSHRHARPYATRPDGSLDQSAVSILCRPTAMPELLARLEAALVGQPYEVQAGEPVGEEVELVVRNRR